MRSFLGAFGYLWMMLGLIVLGLNGLRLSQRRGGPDGGDIAEFIGGVLGVIVMCVIPGSLLIWFSKRRPAPPVEPPENEREGRRA